MKRQCTALFISFLSFSSIYAKGVDSVLLCDHAYVTDTVDANPYTHLARQTDLIDIVAVMIHRPIKADTGDSFHKLRISAVPAAGYSTLTGLAVVVAANFAFYTDKQTNINLSNVSANLTYSKNGQIMFPIQTNIFTKDNKYNIVADWRYLYFPSYTYGLGMYNSLSDASQINYSAIRLHQKGYRKVTSYFYAGLGYDFDFFWNITEEASNKVTDFDKYGITATEYAAGLTVNLLYDSRENSINPAGGQYLNVTYRPNLAILGNSETWRSLVIDARKYIKLSKKSDNILAFWSYNWFTINGMPPYLLLPNTGGDAYNNTGRGYIQGRFRGRDMLYLESEYRFGITHNGLVGGVVFANAETFAEQKTNRYEVIAPACGVGLRLKLNKYSRTNIALDYGVGLHGSNGFSVNLGEVF